MRVRLMWALTLCLSGCCYTWHDDWRAFDAGRPRPLEPAAIDDTAVVEPPTPPPAISGGTLAVLADGTAVVADPDRDLVYLVGVGDDVRTLRLEKNDEPGRVTAGPPGKVFVALRRAGQVAEVDVDAGLIVARHGVCPSPRGVGWSSRKSTLYVACATGDLAQLGFENGAVVSLKSTHPAEDLRDVMVVDEGVLFTTFRTPNLWLLANDGAVSALAAPGAVRVNDRKSADDLKQFVPRVAWRTVATKGGAALMVHQRAQVTAVAPPVVEGSSIYGVPPSTSNLTPSMGTVHTVVTALSRGVATERAVVRDAVLPVDLAISPDESTILIAAAAHGVLRLEGGQLSDVLADPARNLQFTAVGFRGTTILAFTREPARLYIRPADGPQRIVYLSDVSVRSTGHQLFHAGTHNSISCASCHPEAGDDGHVWNLPEGLRRTPSLRGGLSGTEPFHWSGELPTMASLLADTLATRMGGLNQSPARVAATLRWLDGQPKLASPLLNPAAVLRGRAVFHSPAIGCASCHGGARGTNNANANVGTGGAFQVPRLVELGYRQPFFHDGRVPSLASRFDQIGGGDLHGTVSALSAGDVEDLLTYLKSL